MIGNSNNSPFQYLNRMERFTALLTDVRYCFAGKAHRMSRENITLMIDDIVHDEHIFYMVFFMGAYYAVKKENRTKSQIVESIDAMKDLMGWEKESIQDKVTLVYGLDFSKIDLTKEEANPIEEFSTLIKLFYDKRKSIKNFIHKRPFYKDILDPLPHATLYVCVLLGKVADFFRSTEKRFDWEQMSDIMEDVFESLLEWISIVAGLTYYHLKNKLGTKEQVSDLLDALKDINGYKKHRKLGDPAEPLNFSELKRDLDKSSVKQIDFEIGEGCPSVVSYNDKNRRHELQNAEDLVIEDEKIKILFNYPLSTEVTLEFENIGGFTRMDVFRCIYEGYKKIYDEEEEDAGDPGSAPNLLNRGESEGRYGIWGHYISELYIEQIFYNETTKTISMFIGS